MKSQSKHQAIKLGNASMVTKTLFVGLCSEIDNPVLSYSI